MTSRVRIFRMAKLAFVSSGYLVLLVFNRTADVTIGHPLGTMSHIRQWGLSFIGLAIALSFGGSCVRSVKTLDTSYVPNFVQLGPQDTVVIEMDKSKFVRVVRPIQLFSDETTDERTSTDVIHTYHDTRILNLQDGSCRLGKRTTEKASDPLVGSLILQLLPFSLDKIPLSVGVDTQVQVVRSGDRVQLIVSKPTGAKTIDIGTVEHKTYWIERTEVVMTKGKLVSLTTGLVFKHNGRYARTYLDGTRLIVVVPNKEEGGSIYELSYPGLEQRKSIRYKSNKHFVLLDFDGKWLLFSTKKEIQAYNVEQRTWTHISFEECT